MSISDEGDPSKRMEAVLKDDMLRLEIYDRTKQAAAKFFTTFGCQPSWVRVSFDLVYRNHHPVYQTGDTINGLAFMIDIQTKDTIEVGSSQVDTWSKPDRYNT